MSEQDNSPETSANSPKSPSTPEKRFSLSKIIENIVLLIAGVAFITSLFSKNKNTETKESHKDTQTEIKEPYKETEQHQKTKEKRTENTSSSPARMSILRGLVSNINEKIKEKMHKNISKDAYKEILVELCKKISISLAVFSISFIITNWWNEIFNGIYQAFKYLFSKSIPLGISISAAIIVALSLIFGKIIVTQLQKGISSLTNKYFISTLAVLALLGGATALLIPSYTNLFREPGYTSPQQDSIRESPEKAQNTPTPTASSTGNKAAEVEQKSTSDLRLHLLYITGGIIAILGLIETNRKNSQDHIRQVHAARRERYIEAVDKLSSEQAPVRLGGVYALVGLVDEWLDDDNIDEKIRTKEGQIIINNLCSYIRSPFSLAEKREILEAPSNVHVYSGNLSEDKAKLREEQDVRRAIFEEMSKRSSVFTKNKKGDIVPSPRAWSDFEFDFSRAPIFYPLNNLVIEQAQFSSAQFYGEANFQDAAFIGNTYFEDAEFTGYASFQGADFTGYANFEDAEFTGNANFMAADFTGNTNFWRTEFTGNAYFGGAVFAGDAHFLHTEFTGNAHFEVTKFTGPTSFKYADFKQYPPIFVSAQFSAQMDQKDYVFFSVKLGSRSIVPGTATLDGKSLQIPLGAVLFDPDSGRISDPAK